VEDALAAGEKVVLWGPIVHNEEVLKYLQKMGAEVIEPEEKNIKQVSGKTVVVRAHGISENTMNELKKNAKKVIDGTCVFVKMVQEKAKELEGKGYHVVVVGEKDHPEVLGTLGHTKKGIAIENKEEAESISFPEAESFNAAVKKEGCDFLPKFGKVGVVAQTTQSKENFGACVGALSQNCRDVDAFNTICSATNARQDSAKETAKKVDLMIVIGGKTSGNTKRLFDVCSETVQSKLVQTSADLEDEWFGNVKKVGIIAGASTPDFVVEEVVQKIKKI